MMSLSISLVAGCLVAAGPSGSTVQKYTVQRPVYQQPVYRQPVVAAPAQLPVLQQPAQTAQQPTAATPAAPATARPAAELFPVETGILAHTNAHRARYGLRPLMLDFGLLGSARRHAHWMSSNHVMQHGGGGVAENIAMGQNSPQEAVTMWMNSSGHRANILNASYSRIGIAAYRSSSGATYWCQQFLP